MSPQASRGAPFPLILGVWLALVAGLAEFGLRMGERYLLGRFVGVGPHGVWMLPLGLLPWFLVPAALLMLAGLRWPGWLTLPRLVGALSFPAFWSLTLLYTPMHRAAGFLLAAGLAVQLGRLVARRPDRVELVARRSLPWLVVAVAAAAMTVFGWTRLEERRVLGQLKPAPQGAPSVLLIIWDTVRGMNLSLYGYGRSTSPALERWAQKGVVFRRAMATAPWTLPSHGSMFTGRHAHELSAALKTPLDATYPTLAEALSEKGYVTGGFVANVAYAAREHGLARGFIRYEDFRLVPGTVLTRPVLARVLLEQSWFRNLTRLYAAPGRKLAEQVNADFLEWVSHRGKRPFFAFLNYFDAHDPYRPPPPFNTRFGADTARPWRPEHNKAQHLGPVEAERELDAYDGGIAYLDHETDRLLKALEARGLLSNTLVIITSDHGEHWGERGLFYHTNSLYRQLLQVPLVMLYPPRIPVKRTVEQVVSLQDLPATVFDITGLEPDGRFRGTSLAGYWRGGELVPARVVLAGNASLTGQRSYSLMADGWHYIKRMNGADELYALEADPFDSLDLAATPAGRQVLERLRATLDSVAGRLVAAVSSADSPRKP